ncbi:hypothetical protein CGLO_08985 [Colletotrichum gloeosporioides Cg-14]|uniref:Uncharacterized protein n=1 Tax=Colletotrichum gloeosporioides (strain Cg-14) TaxID=1237896 RepID=T0KEU3_COLGC|nr:hypothetical protein CGLO_08985 [Colletotrichum gloeosporioides Cg-14]
MLPTPIWTDHAVISDAIISLPHPANARSHQLCKSHVWRARAQNRPAYRPGTRSLASVTFPAPAPGAGSGKLPSTTQWSQKSREDTHWRPSLCDDERASCSLAHSPPVPIRRDTTSRCDPAPTVSRASAVTPILPGPSFELTNCSLAT